MYNSLTISHCESTLLSKAPGSISVFDLDHTLLNCNSSFRFALYLYKKKRLSLFKMLYVGAYYIANQLCWISVEDLYRSVFKRIFLGESSTDMKAYAEIFVAENIDQLLFQPVVNEVRNAQVRGEYTVILSSSPSFLVAPIAKYVGVNEWGAVCYSEDLKKRYTAISTMMAGTDKASYIHSLIVRFKLSIENVTAYTDSYLDLPMLKAAGQAVCVNPDKKLYKIAKRNNWKILTK